MPWVRGWPLSCYTVLIALYTPRTCMYTYLSQGRREVARDPKKNFPRGPYDVIIVKQGSGVLQYIDFIAYYPTLTQLGFIFSVKQSWIKNIYLTSSLWGPLLIWGPRAKCPLCLPPPPAIGTLPSVTMASEGGHFVKYCVRVRVWPYSSPTKLDFGVNVGIARKGGVLKKLGEAQRYGRNSCWNIRV